jgi:hypothetical protein
MCVPEVLSSSWAHISTKGHLDSATRTATDGNIEENNWVGHF